MDRIDQAYNMYWKWVENVNKAEERLLLTRKYKFLWFMREEYKHLAQLLECAKTQRECAYELLKTALELDAYDKALGKGIDYV